MKKKKKEEFVLDNSALEKVAGGLTWTGVSTKINPNDLNHRHGAPEKRLCNSCGQTFSTAAATTTSHICIHCGSDNTVRV